MERSVLLLVLLLVDFVLAKDYVISSPVPSPVPLNESTCSKCNVWVGTGVGLGVTAIVLIVIAVITVLTVVFVMLRKRRSYEPIDEL